ncbi:hypothetical protein [Williamsia sterculiae]|uniref:hypothetical protein n=1 Tax=Williamsia sterculiae TaxID=1344003 RepID=UPI00117E3B55|nr:hypothetical protein [Williamsia sterculiae]
MADIPATHWVVIVIIAVVLGVLGAVALDRYVRGRTTPTPASAATASDEQDETGSSTPYVVGFPESLPPGVLSAPAFRVRIAVGEEVLPIDRDVYALNPDTGHPVFSSESDARRVGEDVQSTHITPTLNPRRASRRDIWVDVDAFDGHTWCRVTHDDDLGGVDR